MSEYFNPSKVCPHSKELLSHSVVTTIRCGPCGLLNPNFDGPLAKLPEREKAKPGRDQEIIDIDDSPAPNKSTVKPLSSAKRRGSGIQIPTLLDFKHGYAEQKRQNANQQIIDRKTKTCFTPSHSIIHFSVGVARFHNNDSMDENGH